MAPSGEGSPENARETAVCSETTDLQATRGPLTRLEIAELICKTVALYFFASVVVSLSYLLLMLFTVPFDRSAVDHRVMFPWTIVMLLTYVFVAVLLWTLSRPIGRRMAGNAATPVSGMGLSAQALMQIAFATTGLYLLLINVKELLRIALQVFIQWREYGVNSSDFLNDVRWQADFWATVLSCVIAGWLLLGSRGAVNLISRLRRTQEDGGGDASGK